MGGIKGVVMRQFLLVVLAVSALVAFADSATSSSSYCVIDLSAGSSGETYPLTFLAEPPKDSTNGFNITEYKTTKLVLQRIPAGSFIMGSDQSAEDHLVTLTRAFYIGVFEVTQKQWELVMDSNPSTYVGNARPVESVSYGDIRGSSLGAQWPSSDAVDDTSFMGKLRAKTGVHFDLPTEAQWEYVCRAGTTTAYSYGDTPNGDYMWYYSNTHINAQDASTPHEVGTRKQNPWGLYDMHGNVSEWCLDWYVYGVLEYGEDPVGSAKYDSVRGAFRMVRGGGAGSVATYCGSMTRSGIYPTQVSSLTGLRLVLMLNTADVTYLNLKGATNPNPATYEEGSSLVFAAPGAVAGYTFAGWTPSQITADMTGPQTVTANWTANRYRIVYQSNGGQGEMPDVECDYDEDIEIAANAFVRDGCAFKGWATESGGDSVYAPGDVVKNLTATDGDVVTLYAVWEVVAVAPVARQRYPWNGKVDIDVIVGGNQAQTYLVSLTAKDLDGGTNLPLKTAWVVGGDVTNSVFSLAPGRYRFVWDADADIASDGDFPRVAVSVSAADGATENLRIVGSQTVYSGVALEWDAADGAEGYNVYRTVGTTTRKLASVAATEFTDPLAYGLNATYFVRAVISGLEGQASNRVSAHGMSLDAPEGALVYLPMDGEEVYVATDSNKTYKVRNYGTKFPYFHRLDTDAEWLWLADREGREPGSMYAAGTADSVIRFPGADEFVVSNTFSVAFWCRPEWGLGTIVDEKDSGNYGVISANYPYVLSATHGGDGGQAGVGIAVGTNGIVVVEHASGWLPATLVYAAEIGTGWTHVAVTIEDNGAPILYVNGTKVRTGKKSVKVKNIVNARLAYGVYGNYKGCIDDFFVFDRALSADEVLHVYGLDTAGDAEASE